MLIKLTWPILGITQKIHDAIFGWVLFQQVNILLTVLYIHRVCSFDVAVN